MKTTIKKEITQEVEIALPYYSTNGTQYYKIVSNEPTDNLSIGIYDNSGNYSIDNHVYPDRALHHACKQITAEEFNKVFLHAFNKLNDICTNNQ
jgi:biopolymer transport protein ExbD